MLHGRPRAHGFQLLFWHVQVRMRQLEDDVGWQVLARGPGADPSEDAAVLHDYFTLDTKLATLNSEWAAACSHFAKVHPFFPGG